MDEDAGQPAPSVAAFFGACTTCLSLEDTSLQRTATKGVMFGNQRMEREEQILLQAAQHRSSGNPGEHVGSALSSVLFLVVQALQLRTFVRGES